MRRSVEIGESEIFDTALEKQFAHGDEEAHQFSRIWREDLVRIIAAHVFCCRLHRGRDDFARRVCEQLAEPFEDLLDLLWIGFSEILHGEIDANVADTSCYLSIGLHGCK